MPGRTPQVTRWFAAAALRAAGLLTTTRTGHSVHHARTPLAELLLAGGARN
ncbi:hypothetical protein [Streptomyces ficellus]|uniref:hypothetical protein n=1 Tax=Streptomyces ficellus TaxID=1977088 RepID=UPI0012E9531F|nr:hypothetical protein [Streptomyces ficellus]